MIANKVRAILKKKYGLMRVSDDMLLLQDIGMEPVEVLEILRDIEESVGVRMPSGDLWASMEWGRNDMSVAQLIAFVEDYAPVNMVAPPKIPQTMGPVAGLYAITRKGVPICCVTGKKCDKLSKAQVKDNSQSVNLCKVHRCAIEQNFRNLAQKVK